MTTPPPVQPRPRIALYSHDTMGLGHIRRNTLLAQTLIKSPLSADVLLISGIRESGAYPLPKGIDSITLPAYHKQPDGSYRSRSLGIDVQRLIRLRAGAISATLSAFEPDLLIVDNVPRGAMDELTGPLEALRHSKTRIVLGLRDIIDTPDVVARQWNKHDSFRFVQEHFDAIWIYGDTRLYDTARAYGLDQITGTRIVNVGYLDPTERMLPPSTGTTRQKPYALCVVGGGQDGFSVAEAFAQAELPCGWEGVIVTGSMMPAPARERLRELTASRPDIDVFDFVNEPLQLLRGAEAVVAMAGYNTTMEVLALNKRAMLVPRVTPRAEQWLRASRLAELGLVNCVHPDALSADTLSTWLAGHETPPPPARRTLDFNGLQRVADQAAQLLSLPSPSPEL
ncbi:MAG: glycosyltransferase [Lautropia sp.]|nr:glycosyltransferase [Lautropia sp.]